MAKFCFCQKCGRPIEADFTIFSFLDEDEVFCDECRRDKARGLKLREEQRRIDESFNSA